MNLIDRASAIAAINGLPDVIPNLGPVTVVTAPVPVKSPTGARRIAVGLNHEYSTMWPIDPLGRNILLQHPGGYYGMHYADDGRLYAMLPAEINHASQPRWRRKSPDCFCYLYLNEIRQFNAGTLKSETLRKFGMPNINGMGESDLSEDDDHIVLCSGQNVFVYEFSTDRIVAEFTAELAFDSLYLLPNNRPLISYFGSLGIQVQDVDWTMRKVAGKNGHMDVASDSQGRPVMVWCNSGDDTGESRNAALAGCPNGIVKVDLTTGKQTCLLSLGWSIAAHISLPDKAEFALVSTYIEKDPSSPIPYANEILRVPLDGSPVQSLGKHGADSSTYQGKPRAAVSQDGTRFIYDSRGDVYLGSVA